MRRIVIIGPGGAGKSTLAREIGARTGLPVVHLDALYWRAGWEPTEDAAWDARIRELVTGERWVMDGNYSRTLDPRLAAADTVVFLDMPRALSLWRVVGRRVRFHGRSRLDMADGCHEQLSGEFLRWIWTYPRARRPKILAKLRALPPTTAVHVLRSRRDVRRFLAGLPSRTGDTS